MRTTTGSAFHMDTLLPGVWANIFTFGEGCLTTEVIAAPPFIYEPPVKDGMEGEGDIFGSNELIKFFPLFSSFSF